MINSLNEVSILEIHLDSRNPVSKCKHQTYEKTHLVFFFLCGIEKDKLFILGVSSYNIASDSRASDYYHTSEDRERYQNYLNCAKTPKRPRFLICNFCNKKKKKHAYQHEELLKTIRYTLQNHVPSILGI